jgi:hypothetical protein
VAKKRKGEEVLKPDAQYISSLNEQLKTHWTKQIKDDDEALEVIAQEHPIDVPKPKIEGFQPIIYHAGTAQDALDRYCGLIDRPIWQVERGWGSKAEKRSEDAEDFFNLFFWDYEAREGPFFADDKEDVLAVGRGFVEITPNPLLWTGAYGYPVQGKGEDFEGNSLPADEKDDEFKGRLKTWKERISNPPISITYLPASTVQVVLSHSKVIEYVQEVKMLQREAVDRWPEILTTWADELRQDPKKGTQEVTILKYGNAKYISLVAKRGMDRNAEQIDISHFAHGMGVCPIALFEGFKCAKREPGLRWRSIIKKAMSAIKMIDELRSSQATRLKMMPMSQYYILEKNQPLPGEKVKPITIDPTEIKRFYADAQPGVLEPSRPPPEAESLDTKVRDEIEWLLPEIAKGMTGAAGTAAWSDRLKLDQVRNYLKPVVNGIALGSRQMAQLVCKAILSPHIAETVYVRKPGKRGSEVIGIGPDEASDVHDRVTAILQTKLPSDRNADIGLAKMAYEFGMDWAWCVEELIGVENPLEHFRRRMIEDVERSDPYRQKLLEDILTEADMIEATEAAVPPEELAATMAGLSPAAQQAIQTARGVPGPAAAPPGAGPGSLMKTGQLTGTISGPSPLAPTPGGAVLP